MSALAIGTIVSQRYRIDRVLGEGGFGITYLAFDLRLEMPVAMKEFLPTFCANRSSGTSEITPKAGDRHTEMFQWGLQRFLEEARTLVKFDHPGIVRVMDYFEHNGTAYLTMQYIEGPTLEEYVRHHHKLPEQETSRLLREVLDAVSYLHRRNIIHRDIKPANILLKHGVSPVIVDFGSARQLLAGRSQNLTVVVSKGYSPWEQYTTKGKIGPWTDLYALAATAYFCLSGHAPEEATDRVDEDSFIPLSIPGTTKLFLSALEAALEVFPENRIQTVRDWRRVLFQHSTTMEPPPEQEITAEASDLKEHDPVPLKPQEPGVSKGRMVAITLMAMALPLVLAINVSTGLREDIRRMIVTPTPSEDLAPISSNDEALVYIPELNESFDTIVLVGKSGGASKPQDDVESTADSDCIRVDSLQAGLQQVKGKTLVRVFSGTYQESQLRLTDNVFIWVMEMSPYRGKKEKAWRCFSLMAPQELRSILSRSTAPNSKKKTRTTLEFRP